MHHHKNLHSSYEFLDAESFPTEEYFDEYLPEWIAARKERDRGEKRTPFILAQIAWLFEKPWRTAGTLGLLDILGAAGGWLLGYLVGQRIIHAAGVSIQNYLTPIICYIIFFQVILYFQKGYGRLRDRRPEDELRSIVLGSSWALFFVVTINFIFFRDVVFSRYVFIIGWFSSLVLVTLLRFGLRELLNILWRYGLAQENVVIAGDAAKDVKWLLEHLHIQNYHGFNILGYLSRKASQDFHNGLSYLGKFDKLTDIAQKQQVDKVFFAMSGYGDQRHNTLLSRLEECATLGISAMIISHVFNDFYFSLTMDGYSSIFVLDRKQPAFARPGYRLVKRFIDIAGSLLIFFVSLPLWLLVIVCIKIQDGGPIFFKHRLVGKGGEIIQVLKFRTMVENAQEILENDPELLQQFSENYKLVNDPRVTWIGKWLRKTSMDELPQLINILKGDMSLVGPRPVKVEELERYGDFKYERIKVRPGLTGFWQVNGRCDTSYEERMQMDKFYMYKCNIWMDLVILLKTPIKVLKAEGAV